MRRLDLPLFSIAKSDIHGGRSQRQENAVLDMTCEASQRDHSFPSKAWIATRWTFRR